MYISNEDEEVLELVKMNYPLADIIVKIAQERYNTLKFFHHNSLSPVMYLRGKFQKNGDNFVCDSLYKECRTICVHGQNARFCLADERWYTYGRRISEKEVYIEHIMYRSMISKDSF